MSTFAPLSCDEIEQLIRLAPNKQSSLDPLPTWLLQSSTGELAPFITWLINLSMSEGTVPTQLKMAVCKQLISYLNQNSLMPDSQSAYRAFHSAKTAIAKVLGAIFTAIDSGDLSLLALLDLSAAFDTVDHDILLHRHHTSFCLSSTVHNWFQSYLTSRTQSVRCGINASSTSVMTCGVPQGSVLGPILFLLHTSDVEEKLSNVSILNATCMLTIPRCTATVDH